MFDFTDDKKITKIKKPLKYLILSLFFCNTINAQASELPPVLMKQGAYTIYDKQALDLLDLGAKLEVLASGFEWTEGPVWDDKNKRLLFVDIPNNKIHSYSELQGVTDFLYPSGRVNGLLIDAEGTLVMMSTATRTVAKLKMTERVKASSVQHIVSHYKGKRLNSPNDVALHRSGVLFFTDPPYGLPKRMDDPNKELDFQGVYRLSVDNKLSLIDDELTFPNGIAISPSQDKLYVAVSDDAEPAWYQYLLDAQGNVIDKSLLFKPKFLGIEHGTTDGLKVHSTGTVFATGPGGVWIFSSDKRLLAQIAMPGFTANLAFNGDESLIYLTAHKELRRLKLRHAD
ncbi:SMP-30/gluconolactonase/LRE family protein [Psychrosphaera sp. B3R10]|uniref:SMP-30/gluconolactonase/LRE family protein n=1 Tax=unclassified Psychrosphaera TaxID=2641570 RepID=UPI001C0A0517|nr:SMP-30/gluconolactonase/LRE family protein [Psychrosphaera sp. I2R16]MBU2990960.1 SMP-30/gluconolactonase/LRE family protein [Psychrosphaera sp. B3R10]